MTTPSTSYRTIPLTRGLHTIVDEKHYDWLSQWNWYAKPQTDGSCFYAARTMVVDGRHINITMHRLILGLTRGDGLLGDHRNGNTLDNRSANLRVATHTQNSRNQKLRITNATGLKGVFRKNDRWASFIQVDRKRIFLGIFLSPQEAHQAYCDAAQKHFGEFARFA